MIRFARHCAAGLGILALAGLGPVGAQENLDSGKTPAQLYAADCAICHKTPQGLTKGAGIFGLSNFLREHYTASRESAAVIATYVESLDRGPPGGAKRPPTKRTAKGDDKGKPGDAKPEQMKSGDAKPAGPKAGEAKADGKPDEAKGGETKSAEPKSTGSKSSDSKPLDSKPLDSKPLDSKPAASKDDKSDKPN